MNYAKKQADVLRALKKHGAIANVSRVERNSSTTTFTARAIRIERRIGDLHRFDDTNEVGDYKFIVEGAVTILEGDIFVFAGERRLVQRIEEFKPTNTRIFTYVWTRAA
jgi:hypothetical protein